LVAVLTEIDDFIFIKIYQRIHFKKIYYIQTLLVEFDQSKTMKLLCTIVFTLLVFLTTSAPINCARGSKELEIMAPDENLCEDHKVCQVGCGIYFKNCRKTAYFNLDKFADHVKTPIAGNPGFEEYKAYHLVCTQKKFTVKENGDREIFKIFNYHISTLKIIKWEVLDSILKYPIGSWDKRYSNLFHKTKMTKKERFVIHSLQKIAISLRNFQKVCPEKNYNLKELQKKFLDFENKYWVKMLKSTRKDRDNDTGLRASLKLKKIMDKYQNKVKKVLHYKRIVEKLKIALATQKKSLESYRQLASKFYLRFEDTDDEDDEKEAIKNEKKAGGVDKKIKKISIELTKANKLFLMFELQQNQWHHYLVLHDNMKKLIIQEVLNLFLNPKFQSGTGGNFCQCFDFTRFATWIDNSPKDYLWNTHEIRKNVVQESFKNNYLPAIRNLCKITCSK
jgi:hypothetical protein